MKKKDWRRIEMVLVYYDVKSKSMRALFVGFFWSVTRSKKKQKNKEKQILFFFTFLWRKKVLDEVSNSASINQNHFFILYVFVSYLFLPKVICYKKKIYIFLVTEKKKCLPTLVFHAKFFKLYPPDSANDLKKKENCID